jgi:trehalose-phosphatase
MRELPRALDCMDEIAAQIRERRPFVFLDFDGTLTPIVDHPDRATLAASVRESLRRLACLCPIAFVSGRDLSDLRARIGLDGVYYAGGHGFEIAGPRGLHYASPLDGAVLSALDNAERELRSRLAGIGGTLLERKRSSLGIHFRMVSDRDLPHVERAVDETLTHHRSLRKRHGKKVFELQPDIAWNKGEAVRWLVRTLGLDGPDVLPIYIGDDLTDEDAFRALAAHGLGIAILDQPRPTAARYQLRDPGELHAFIDKLVRLLP